MERLDPIEKLERDIDERFSFVVGAMEELAKIIAGIDTRLENLEKTIGELKTDLVGIDRELGLSIQRYGLTHPLVKDL